MPLNNFTRPPIPYDNAPLPNDNRFDILTNVLKKPVTVSILEGEFNKLTDNDNILDNKIEAVVAGNIPGSNNPLNANKFLTTDGAGTLSFVSITDNNIGDQSITASAKLVPLSILSGNLGNGIVTPDKIPDNSIPYSKTTFNDGIIPGAKITGKSITQAQQGLLSVGTPELINTCVTQQKIALLAVGTPQLIDASIMLSKLNAEVINFINALVPVGASMEWPCNSAPVNIANLVTWIEENGQAISRVTYASLFAKIGTIYGAGDGVNTFNVPDKRGRTTVGIGSDNNTGGRITGATAPSITLGGAFGTETHTLTIAQMPSHTHALSLYAPATYASGGASQGTNQNNTFPQIPATQATGGGAAHPNVPPSLFMRYYIRAL